MIDERQQKRAALHVLGLLEGAESETFEAEVREDGKLQQLVRELREASASFALTVPKVEPPHELQTRVIAGFARPSSQANALPMLRPVVVIPWTIVAALAIACAWLAQLYLQGRSSESLFEDERALSKIELATLKNQLEAERIIANRQMTEATSELTGLNEQLVRSTEKIIDATRLLGRTYDQLDITRAELLERQAETSDLAAQLSGARDEISTLRNRSGSSTALTELKIVTLTSPENDSPKAAGVVIWNPATREGVVRIDQLSPPPAGKDYQLWLSDASYPHPIDAGVLVVDAATNHPPTPFKPTQPITHATRFSVSIERKGGASAPEGSIVLVGDLP